MGGQSMIELKAVDVVFRQQDRVIKAVSNVSMTIDKGEIFGIVGYSGAGKSTLVRTINLLQRPSKGQVKVNGQDMLSLSAGELRQARKKIGMIFQHFNLMEARTIFDNVAFPLKYSGLSQKEIAHKVAELLDLVGLRQKSDQYPKQLSGGQKQRVAIARALANDPDILLCDEATSALDPKTTTSILQLLQQLNQRFNLTIVIITHEMNVVKDICDRVAVMEAGTVLEQGSIIDIFTQPQETLTKEFINTATHFDQEMEIVMQHPSIQGFVESGHFYRLTYIGHETTQPLMAKLMKDYDVQVNILYGHVEIIQNIPTGNLLVAFEGESEKIEKALTYLESQSVRITRSQELIQTYLHKEDNHHDTLA